MCRSSPVCSEEGGGGPGSGAATSVPPNARVTPYALPPPARPKGKGKGKDKQPRKGKSKSKSARSGGPDFMQGCALRCPPTRAHPQGQAFCFGYHNPDRRGCDGTCNRVLLCPKFLPDGSVCLREHALWSHS